MTPDRERTLEEALWQIIIRCTEGDKRSDWLPVIQGIAERALASPAQEPAPSAEVEEVNWENVAAEVYQAVGALLFYLGLGDDPDCIRIQDVLVYGKTMDGVDLLPWPKDAAALRRYAGDGGVTEGWRLVPVVPTKEMIFKGQDAKIHFDNTPWKPGQVVSYGPIPGIWQAMLEAAARAKSGEKGRQAGTRVLSDLYAARSTIAEQKKRIEELKKERDETQAEAQSLRPPRTGLNAFAREANNMCQHGIQPRVDLICRYCAEQALTAERQRRESAEAIAKPLTQAWASYGNTENGKLDLLRGTLGIWHFQEAADHFIRYPSDAGNDSADGRRGRCPKAT